MFYISAVTQKVHTDAECSVTRRNHARNLATSATATELREAGYQGCKRCDADKALAEGE
jgi:methylphosphotriester-DNA--protein-cysteine methyltransferase